MDANFYGAHFGRAYMLKGRYEEAISACQTALSLSETSFVITTLGMAYARSGQRDEALRVLDRLDELATRQYVRPRYRAEILFALGEVDQGFAWLERAYQERDGSLKWLNVGPSLADSLRADARFTALIKKVGFDQ
ncbi:MAG: tetratricopeptide repeat protein [Bacteroidetes bacterium]|nr:tetratricopeptide repeat protein [Bacteroidota bacterium]